MNTRISPLPALAAAALIALADPGGARAAQPGPGAPPAEAYLGHALDAANLDFMVEAGVHGFKLAHSGQLSPKDGCHRSKALKERHWHRKGGAERGGPCIGKPSLKVTEHALCAKERIAFARDKRDGRGVAWERHAQALKSCILRIKPRPVR